MKRVLQTFVGSRRCSLVVVAALLLLLLCVPPCRSTTTLPCVTVGVLYSSIGVYADTGARTVAVMNAWADLVAAKPELGFVARIVTADVQSDASQVVSVCNQLLSSTNVTFLVAPESALTILANQCANAARVPILGRVALSNAYKCTEPPPFPIGSSCRHVNDRAYEYAFTVLQPASVQFRDYYSLVRIAGAKTAAVVYFEDNFHTESCVAGALYAELNRIRVLATFRIPLNFTADTIRTIVERLRQLQPDVVTWCHRLGCAADIAAFKAADYLPPSLIMLQCTDSHAQVAAFGGTDLQYVAGAVFWSPQAAGPSYADNPSTPYASHFAVHSESNATSSAEAFTQWLSTVVAEPITFTDASTVAVGYLIEAAVSGAAPSLAPVDLRQALASVNLNCFWGALVADTYGMDSFNAVVVTQLDAQLQLQLLSPTSTATASIIYPIPTWSERVYACRYAASFGARITIALLAIVCAVYASALVVVCRHRASRPMAGTSVPMLCTSLVGAMLSSAGVLTWLDENTSVTCVARVPVFLLGFTLLLLPMVARSWVLHRIIKNTSVQRDCTDVDAHVRVLACIAAPVWTVTALLSAAYPLQTQRVAFDPLRPSTSLTVCTILPAHRIATVICNALLSCMMLLIVGAWLWLAARSRRVSHPLLAETQRIMLSVSLLALLLGILSAVQFGVADADRATTQMKQVIRGVGLLLSVLLCVLVLYGARIVRALRCALPGTVHPPRLSATALGESTRAVLERSLPRGPPSPPPAMHQPSPTELSTVRLPVAEEATADQSAMERDPPPSRA